MAATPQYATFTLVGARSGKTYSVDAYISDVANAALRFDGGSGAGAATPDYWTCPEPCILKDISIVTGTQDTTKLQLQRNNTPTGDMIRYVPHVSTNAFRPALNIGFQQGMNLRATQLA